MYDVVTELIHLVLYSPGKQMALLLLLLLSWNLKTV